MNFRQQVALVTGGSSGIGLATAKLLAARGSHVWLVARRPDRLEAALAEVNAARQTPSQRCGAVAADISDPAQAASAMQRISETAGAPDIIIHSVGIVCGGYCEELDLAAYRDQIAVNYLGAVNVTKAALPAMLARRSGHIVNVCSVAGFLGVFGYAAYGASKYALRGFSDALRAELKPHGIGVSIVFPDDTDTPHLAYDKATRPPEIDRMMGSTAQALPPAAVAQAILNGIARRRYVITPGFDATLLYWLAGIAGTLQYPIMDFLVARAMRHTRHGQGILAQEGIKK